MKSAFAIAPGKVILTGEHACVYDEPAIAMAISIYAKATAKLRRDDLLHISSHNLGCSGFFKGEDFIPELGGLSAESKLRPIQRAVKKVLELASEEIGIDLEINSEIPLAVGLGSSAAVIVSSVGAVNELMQIGLSKEEIRSIAYEGEKLVHGTPSGIDDSISTYGGIMLFKKSFGCTPIKLHKKPLLVVGNTGIRRSTGELVRKVRELKAKIPSIINGIISLIGDISSLTVKELEEGDWEGVGFLMNLNHELLSALGLSNEALDKLILAARRSGAYGAKLTGGGGGGCMIALVSKERAKDVVEEIKKEGGIPMLVEIDEKGLVSWRE